jgi:ABC-type dipeptide/oligopeptide/nickel transport system permease component
VLNYLLRRIPQLFPTLILASMLTFFLLRVVPGDVADVLAMEGGTSNFDAERIRAEMGFDDPIPIQYVRWVGGFVRGDFGSSYFTGISVAEMFRHAFPKTALLAVTSLSIAILIGIPLGLLAGAFKGSIFDHLATLLATTMTAIPTFALGIVALLIFAVQLRWFPAVGSVILPSLVLGVDLAGNIVRTLRTDVRAELQSDYIRTARAKGLAEAIVLRRHVLRNALTSTVTVIGLILGNLLGGTVIVETVFNWPGIGSLTIGAIRNRDYAVVQAMVMVMTVAFVFANVLVDLLYGLLDPRVRIN